MDVQIRWLIRRDMPEVLDIEEKSFEYVWTEETFLSHLRQRNCIGMVAEYDSQVVGFVMYELHKGAIEILNFAVDSYYRRASIGRQMADRLKDKLSQQRRREIFFTVRETNIGAQLFFSELEFCAVSVLRNYFEDANEDAFVFRYQLDRSDKEFAPGLSPKNRISNFLDADVQHGE